MATNDRQAQTEAEMIRDINEKRGKKKNNLYKVQADEHRGEVLADIVRQGAQELVETVARGKIPLDDADAVKRQTMAYLAACEKAGSLPSIQGLARSLGYSRQALYDVMESGNRPETADFLELCRDMFSDMLSQAALSNNVNFTYAIFIQKAIHQLRESVEIIARPAAPLGESADASTIAEKYRAALPAAFDTDEEQ